MSKINEDYDRLDYLDLIRAVAACTVLFFHTVNIGALPYIYAKYFQLGQFGVLVFFLCSGFIITKSIYASKSSSSFWIRRLFRIYPLYLLDSIIVMCFMKNITFLKLISNLFIAGAIFHNTIIDVSWTLTYEMIFYFSIWILWKFNIIHRIKLHILIIVIISIFTSIACHYGIINRHWVRTPIQFLAFFVGMYFCLSNNYKNNLIVTILSVVVTIISTYLGFGYFSSDNFVYTHSGVFGFIPISMAWSFAFIFFACIIYIKPRVPKVLSFVGVISYSIYLNHGVIIQVFGVSKYILPTIILAVISAIISYYLIEKPSILCGKYIIKKYSLT